MGPKYLFLVLFAMTLLALACTRDDEAERKARREEKREERREERRLRKAERARETPQSRTEKAVPNVT